MEATLMQLRKAFIAKKVKYKTNQSGALLMAASQSESA
jgi:hypothetical protein